MDQVLNQWVTGRNTGEDENTKVMTQALRILLSFINIGLVLLPIWGLAGGGLYWPTQIKLPSESPALVH